MDATIRCEAFEAEEGVSDGKKAYEVQPVKKRPQLPLDREVINSLPLEKINQVKFITLTRYINDYERKQLVASNQFGQFISAIQIIAKAISTTLRKSGIGQRYMLGFHESFDMSPHHYSKLFDDIVVKTLIHANCAALIVSKNVEDIIKVSEAHAGEFLIAISTLDDELTMDVTSCKGTLFTLYKCSRRLLPGDEVTIDDILQRGANAIAAGYIIYGSATLLILAFEERVRIFSLDPILGEFILTIDNWKSPPIGYMFSINEGFSLSWDLKVSAYLASIKHPENQLPWYARHSGSLTADCHQIIQAGGICLYPANTAEPFGKLGLLYEAIPIAYVAHAAGCDAFSGIDSILSIVPGHIHERVPFYMGSRAHVAEIRKLYGSKIAYGKELPDVND